MNVRHCGYIECVRNRGGLCLIGEQASLNEHGTCRYAERRTKWISVEDRLPEDFCTMLVALEGLNIAFCGWYQDGKWWKVGAGTRPFTQKVTHWMPLPQPPKGE